MANKEPITTNKEVDTDTDTDTDKRMSSIETSLAALTKTLTGKMASATKKPEEKPDDGSKRLDGIEQSIDELKKVMDNFIAAGGVVNEGGEDGDSGFDENDGHEEIDTKQLEDLDYSI